MLKYHFDLCNLVRNLRLLSQSKTTKLIGISPINIEHPKIKPISIKLKFNPI